MINLDTIPDELKSRAQWVCYRLEERDGHITKIPYQIGRTRARTTDPITWSSLESVLESAKKPNNRFNGVGFILSAKDPYVFIDLDHVIKDGNCEPWAQEIIEKVNSYTEYSQSGTGIHILAKAAKPGPRCRISTSPQFEIYDNARFAIFTGNRYPNTPCVITEATNAVQEIYFKVFGNNPRNIPVKEIEGNSVPIGMSDPVLIQKAQSSKNGDKFSRLWNGNTSDYSGDDSSADQALCNMLAFWTCKDPVRIDRLFRQSGLMRSKWERADYRESTIRKAIDACGETYQPTRHKKNKAKGSADITTEESGEIDKFTDLGNAERLVSKFGNEIRYCYTTEKWLVWNEKYWEPDHAGHIHMKAQEIAKRLSLDVAAAIINKEDSNVIKRLANHAQKSQSDYSLNAMVHRAQTVEGMPISSDELNNNPWLLNVENGTLDLRTGKLGPHTQADFITKMAPVMYDPDAKCPRWNQFLNEITLGDIDLQEYLQRVIGYSMTGDTSEEQFYILHGKGGSGKSKFLEVIRETLGNEQYAKHTPMATFLQRKNNSNTNDLAALPGARFVTASESNAGQHFDETLIKGITGRDPMGVRSLYKEFFTFKPTCKLFIATNEVPAFESQGSDMTRRLRIIPFLAEYHRPEENIEPVMDMRLIDKLLKEKSGILNWMLEGCRKWQKDGLREPDMVRRATADAFRNADPLGDWLEEYTVKVFGERTRTRELYDSYSAYIRDNHTEEKPMSMKSFNESLAARSGIYKTKSNGQRYLSGIVLRVQKSAAA